MNERQKQKEFRENATAISNFMMDNNLTFDRIKKYSLNENENEGMFGALYMSWRRSRCAICDDLISIGDYAIFSHWSFFGSYAKSRDFHVKCFYKQLESDLDHIEHWIKSTHFMIKQEDYDSREFGRL